MPYQAGAQDEIVLRWPHPPYAVLRIHEWRSYIKNSHISNRRYMNCTIWSYMFNIIFMIKNTLNSVFTRLFYAIFSKLCDFFMRFFAESKTRKEISFDFFLCDFSKFRDFFHTSFFLRGRIHRVKTEKMVNSFELPQSFAPIFSTWVGSTITASKAQLRSAKHATRMQELSEKHIPLNSDEMRYINFYEKWESC